MLTLLKGSKSIIIAILSGAIPAIFWLWFWFREEDDEEKEPVFLIALNFIMGGLLVFLAIWLERYSMHFIGTDPTVKIVVWASIEEILKLTGVMIILINSRIIKEPIDYPMYFIAVALGFAAIENILYLVEPLRVNGAIITLLTGNLRFLGSTLLHATASSVIGSSIGLAYYLKNNHLKYLFSGIVLAIMLHSTFNFFIMKEGGKNFLSVFGFLWVVVIINILIFEKLRRMRNTNPIT